MNLLKYWWSSRTNQCTSACKTALDALDEQNEHNRMLRRELHTRNDQIVSLTKKLEDRQSHINRLSDQLNKRKRRAPNVQNAVQADQKATT